ncbi:DUF2911 domain-containing protein [Christiangramia forsetii]|uniref:Secreted protein n=2 Tax=Christiangramia forsetii TaxID=411153 RepID=A0M2E4_CHRFK|nr:DUF2911 domain-containing protein [Christiangramia forsetii]GGG39354.1 hypothetical protein GCM10011532_23880 [Christiangramia forsetii]CAL66789.1 conserved hypothetical protein, secreted [Christiangramia forsetii KT0803]
MKKLLSLAVIFCLTFSVNAQIESPQPSPFGKIEQKVGLTDVTVEYSRPGMRGRTIFGDLVPFGEVWRTGANANTKITFSDDIKINGKELKKGSYSIYTKPQRDSWEVMFYSSTDNWGVPQEWDDSKVALKATAETMEMPMNMETFTIVIDDLKNDSAALNFIWENTVAMLKMEVPTETKAMASIDKVMNGPTANDYFAAGTYYHEAGKDLDKAYKWVSKASEMAGDQAFWMLRRKSLIEAEMGKKQEAIATAKKSMASAEKANNADYVKMNKESIAEWGGSK